MAIDFGLIWTQAVVGIAIYVVFPAIATLALALLLIGSAQHGMGLVAHEGAHHLIARERRHLNDLVARWLFAAPTMLPFALYRQRHFAHHRHVATELETKELNRRDIRGSGSS